MWLFGVAVVETAPNGSEEMTDTGSTINETLVELASFVANFASEK